MPALNFKRVYVECFIDSVSQNTETGNVICGRICSKIKKKIKIKNAEFWLIVHLPFFLFKNVSGQPVIRVIMVNWPDQDEKSSISTKWMYFFGGGFKFFEIMGPKFFRLPVIKYLLYE